MTLPGSHFSVLFTFEQVPIFPKRKSPGPSNFEQNVRCQCRCGGAKQRHFRMRNSNVMRGAPRALTPQTQMHKCASAGGSARLPCPPLCAFVQPWRALQPFHLKARTNHYSSSFLLGLLASLVHSGATSSATTLTSYATVSTKEIRIGSVLFPLNLRTHSQPDPYYTSKPVLKSSSIAMVPPLTLWVGAMRLRGFLTMTS